MTGGTTWVSGAKTQGVARSVRRLILGKSVPKTQPVCLLRTGRRRNQYGVSYRQAEGTTNTSLTDRPKTQPVRLPSLTGRPKTQPVRLLRTGRRHNQYASYRQAKDTDNQYASYRQSNSDKTQSVPKTHTSTPLTDSDSRPSLCQRYNQCASYRQSNSRPSLCQRYNQYASYRQSNSRPSLCQSPKTRVCLLQTEKFKTQSGCAKDTNMPLTDRASQDPVSAKDTNMPLTDRASQDPVSVKDTNMPLTDRAI